jgi:Tfp pilus assembly protein PilF
LRLNPNQALAYNNRGFVRFKKGDRAGAEADYRRALAIEPDNPLTRANLKALGVEP